MRDCEYQREGGRGTQRVPGGSPLPSSVFLPYGRGFVLVGRPAVVQDLAYPFHEIHPHLGAQVGCGELVRQVEELSPFVIVQRFILVVLLHCCRRRCNLPPGADKQPLLYSIHGGVVIIGHRLVMHPGIDHRRVEAGYNALGQKKRYTLGNGAVSTWTYYGESQAAVLRHPCPVDRL